MWFSSKKQSGKSLLGQALYQHYKQTYSHLPFNFSMFTIQGGPNAQSAADLTSICESCGFEYRNHLFTPPYANCDNFVPLTLTIDSSYTYEQQELETMTRLTSDLQDAGVFTTIPNGIYVAHVCEVRDTDKNDIAKPLVSQAGAPMVQLDWELEEGDFAGKKVKFDTLMLGGMSREGKPISLSNLCNFLHRTGVPWECQDCKNGERGRKFYIAERDNEDDKARGLKAGNFYCPDCKSPKPRIAYDTVNFKGARCKIGVGSKTQDGREFNIVKGYTDI